VNQLFFMPPPAGVSSKENCWPFEGSVRIYSGLVFAPWYLSSGAAGIGCSGL